MARRNRDNNAILRGNVIEYIGGPTGNHSLVYKPNSGELFQKDGTPLPSNPLELHQRGISIPHPLRDKLLRDTHEKRLQREMARRRAELEEELLRDQEELQRKLAEIDAAARRGEMDPIMVEANPLPEPPPPLFPEEVAAYTQEQEEAAEEEDDEEPEEEAPKPATRGRRRSS